jgi:hypothetical protein
MDRLSVRARLTVMAGCVKEYLTHVLSGNLDPEGQVELRQVYLLTVVEELRATERLPMVQPAGGQQLRRLERELDVQLFRRSTRLSLSPGQQHLRAPCSRDPCGRAGSF